MLLHLTKNEINIIDVEINFPVRLLLNHFYLAEFLLLSTTFFLEEDIFASKLCASQAVDCQKWRPT